MSGPEARGPSRRPRGAARTPRARSRRLLALAAPALIALAVIAPVGHAAGTGRSERAAARHAEEEAARSRRQAERLSRQEERRANRSPRQSKERPNAVIDIGCSGLVITYRGFPDAPGNVVRERVRVDGEKFPAQFFTFDGPEAVQTIPVAAPVGQYMIDVSSRWKANGVIGHFDVPGNVVCPPRPQFTVEKLQMIAGSEQPFTTERLTARVGQTVEYEILVTNTGNTPLTFTRFTDPRCDPGTIAGGASGPVEPFTTVTYTCSHTFARGEEGTDYENVATIRGTPEEGEGPPHTQESNTVVVGPVGAEEKEGGGEKEGEKGGGGGGGPEVPIVPGPKEETLGTITSSPGTPVATVSKTGVLGFSTATVPALHGPEGCVRGAFVASIRSAGVASVTFYLDGHPIRHLTSHNAHKGLLSVRIDASKLKVGPHRLMARITMKQTSPSAKAARATRSLTIVRCHSAVITPRFTG